ncbi:MAG: hypothetical protein KGO03_08690 [Gemmatimonadota bacterium]|nr:hypothetical protein [Gemmatimonadota bacterium]
MTRHATARRLVSACAALALLALAAWMAAGGVHAAARANTLGQRLENAVQFVCALLGVATAVTRYRRHRLIRAVRIAWAIALAAVAGLSGMVWGPPMPLVALLFVLAALAVAWAMLRALGTAAASPNAIPTGIP